MTAPYFLETFLSAGWPLNTRVNANQFGLPVALIGAPTAGALHVGSARLASPLAYAVTAGTSAAAITQPFDGVIGNALFAGHVLVVDVPAGRSSALARQWLF